MPQVDGHKSSRLPDATQELKNEYDAEGKPYYMEEREYYSTGGVVFNATKLTGQVAGQYDRYWLQAQAGQQANLFAYQIGQNMAGANVFTTAGTVSRVANPTDTNLIEAYKTNEEDFAIRGVGIQVKGLRVEYTPADVEASPIQAQFLPIVTGGIEYFEDPGSFILPPEVDSPLVLSDVLGRAIMKRLKLTEVWNTRATDEIALARGLGPGGSETYLKAQGQPSVGNCRSLSPGLKWRRNGAPSDVKFNVLAELFENVNTIVTWTQALTAAGTPFGTLNKVYLDYQVVLFGHAFYYPSGNA